jgi:deoxyribonuclease V
MTEHPELAQLQREMATQVLVCPDGTGYQPEPGHLWFTFDVQYVGKAAFTAVDVQTGTGELLGVFVKEFGVEADYYPGYFALREGPILDQALAEVRAHTGWLPHLLIVDGHGRAHPRKFGVACWLGVMAQLPSLGCAKETLVPYTGELGNQSGDRLPIVVEHEVVGYALRTQVGVKPVFVSPGHAISLATSAAISLQLASSSRQLESIRRADQAARAFAKGTAGNYTRLG